MQIGINLASESVRQAGPREALCVDQDTPLRKVLELMRDQARGAVLVCRDAKLVGIFTERDALRRLAHCEDLGIPIERYMSPKPATIRSSDTVGTAVRKMSTSGFRRLPIVDDAGRPLGLLDVSGIVHWLVQHFPEAVYNLPPVSKHVTQEREGP